MPLTNCKIILVLTWSASRFKIANPVNNQVPTFAITDAQLFVPVITL